MSKSDENTKRALELHQVIAKAEMELESLEPKRSFLSQLQKGLDAFDAKRNAGGDYESVGIALANLLTDGLNMLNDRLQGEVRLHSDSLTIGTDVGVMTYDTDNEEWYFTEDKR